MRAVLGIAVATGGVALLAYVLYSATLQFNAGASASTASIGGTPNNPTISQDQQHKGISTGGHQ